MDGKEILKNAGTILLIDWPSKDVPEALIRAGFRVFVHGGPGAEDYSAYEFRGNEIVSRRTGCRPEKADLVYSFRPLSEVAKTIAEANAVGAKHLWVQSGLSSDGRKDAKGCWMAQQELRLAENEVKTAGLNLITQPYIGDVARAIGVAAKPDSADA